MRRIGGWLLALLGVAALAAGAIVAVTFGPDDTVTLGPHQLSSTGAALISAPGAISYAGPTLQVTAALERPNARVFIGVGHDVDVRDYLSEATYTQIDEVSLPWRTSTSEVPGRAASVSDPTALTWWLTSASGRGAATVTFPLPAAAIDVVVIDVDGATGFTTDVTVSVISQGAFVGAAALLVGGVGLLVVGSLVLRRRSASDDRPSPAPAAPLVDSVGP